MIAETIATLPLFVYQNREPRGKDRAPRHPLYQTLHSDPNPEMTSVEFRMTQFVALLLRGNAYAQKIPTQGGGYQLWPLLPQKMKVGRDPQSGQLIYSYTKGPNETVPLSSDEVWHLRGLSSDGILGYGPVALHRESLGLSSAAMEYGARVFGSGSTPGGVLEHPAKLTPSAAERIAKDWREMHAGLDNAHKVAVLEEGMKWHQITLSPEDSQFLETRKYQTAEIARIFRVPPHMIGDLDRATNNNIEQQSLEFVIHTIRPWLVLYEQSANKHLVRDPRYFAEFVVEGLLRGDTATRYAAYAIGRQWGFLSPNDIREYENMPLIAGGDTYLAPLNMVPAEMLGKAPPPADAPVRAFRDLLIDGATRLLTREAADTSEARAKFDKRTDPAGFADWLDRYQARSREAWFSVLGPIARSYLAARGFEDNSREILEAEWDARAEELRVPTDIAQTAGEIADRLLESLDA